MKKIQLSNRMRNVAKISSGTALGQIISIVTLPVLTRIYGAEVMGIWATIYAVASIVITFSDLGLSQALMIGEEDEVESIYRFVSSVSLVISIISAVAVSGYKIIFAQMDFKEGVIFGAFIFVYGFALRQVQTCYTWLNREQKYSVLMKNPIINFSTVAIIAIALGLVGFKEYGYYIGMTMGQVLTLFHMKRFLPRKMFSFDICNGKQIMHKYNEFIKFQMPTQITVQVRQQIPNLLIGALFGNTMLGYFSISQKLLSIPVTFIGQSLGKVFYQTLAEMRRKGQNLAEFVYRNLWRAMKIAFIPMVLLAAYGDAAIVMFFGDEYVVGGIICRIIVFRSFFTFVSTATQGLDIVINRQKLAMMTCIYQTVLASLSVILSYYITGNVYVCALLMTISFIVIQVWYFCKMFSVMNYSIIKYLKSITISVVGILICSLIMRHLFIFVADIVPWDFLKWLSGFLAETKI